jgi:conjugative transfer signal peptidase TraF
MITGTALALVGALALPVLLWGPSPLSINLSESLPFGLYWTRPLPHLSRDPGESTSGGPGRNAGPNAGLKVGMLVSACLPPDVALSALEKGYLPKGPCLSGVAPVGKIIAALPGDTVDVTGSGAFVNGVPLPGSAPLLSDSRGRPMPRRWGRVVLPAQTAWLYSGHSPRSFDSRYYGPVPFSGLRGQLFPLLTWGQALAPSSAPPEKTAAGNGGPRTQATP